MRSRASTDAVIPSRAGYPTATLASTNRYKALSNYHQMTDTPENVSYRTVLHALSCARPSPGELAASPWVGAVRPSRCGTRFGSARACRTVPV